MVAGRLSVDPFGDAPGESPNVGRASPTRSSRLALRPYQRQGIEYARRVKHPALFWEMRLGKTIVAIRTTQSRGEGLILIVAPYSAFQGWRDDLQTEGEGSPVELTGKQKDRRGRLADGLLLKPAVGRVWFLLNLQGWVWIPEIAAIPWQSVILDESTFIKDPRAKCSRFFVSNFREVPFRWILSGTPAPESDLDFWAQAAFLDRSILGSSNFWQFRQRWAEQSRFDWILKPEGKAFISSRLSGRVSFLSRASVKLGGVKIRRKRLIQIPETAWKIYRKLARAFVLDLPGEKDPRRTIYAGQRHVWFRRVADGLIPDAPTPILHWAKTAELLSLLGGELQGAQTVVWAVYVAEVEWLANSIPGAKAIHGAVKPAQRDDLKRRFQSGQVRHLIMQPETMKFGAKLTAADAAIYFSSPEGGLTRSQSEDRSIDLSRKDNALIIDLIAEKTIDEDITESLLRKETRSETMRRIVRGLERAAA